MNVLIVASALPNKKNPLIGIFEFDQAKALSNAGNDVTYFAIDLRSMRHFRKLGILYERRDNIDCYKINVPLGRVPSFLSYNIGGIALKLLYKYVYCFKKRQLPDIIHAHFTMPAFATASLVKHKEIPFVVTEHSSELLHQNCSKSVIYYARMAYGQANQVIAVSDFLGKAIFEKTNICTKTIFNIADLDIFSSVIKKEHEGFRFVIIANLIESKNHLLLLDAFRNVLKTMPNTYLEIIGDGPLKENLLKIIEEFNIESYVNFYGQLERKDMVQILEKCDCFVLPSNFETFGVAYIEAMAAGLPVIATKCGGPESFIIDKVGLIVELNDVNQLSNAMKYMIDNYVRYDSDEIKQYAKNHFSSEVIVDKLMKEYKTLIATRNS